MIRTVPPEGSLDSRIAIIGEAPGYEEIEQGKPFVGRSGQLLNDLLVRARIPRNSCYITNVFKQQVVKKGESFFLEGECVYNKKGFIGKGITIRTQLIEELKTVSSNIMIPLGNPALEALTGKKGITKWRGSLLWSDAVNVKCLPTIHPAAALRQYIMKHLILFDLSRAKEEGEFKELNLPQIKYIIDSSFLEATAYLKSIIKQKTLTAFDIEVLRGEISHVSFCNTSKEVISIPFIRNYNSYFTLEQEAEIFELIALILEDKAIKKVGQNLAFDTTFFFEKYGIVTKNIEDTMIAQKLFFPDFKSGLDFITSTRTRLPYYKDEGKSYMKIGGDERDFSIYNARDSWVCFVAFPSIADDLKRINNYTTYENQRLLIPITTFMGLKGLKVDVAGLQKEKERAQNKVEELQKKLNNIVGTELNPRSSQQVSTYFYIKKGLTPYKTQGRVTADEGALKRIARKGYEEAKLILDIRHYANRISKYYNVTLKGDRLRCSYKPVTAMGRLASSEDIFGYGTNLQNQPKDMNKFFMADEGYLMYNLDLSQADNRSVAYMAPEPRMIKAFEEGIDIHSLTASMLFDIPVEKVKEFHTRNIKSDLGYGDKTHRDWGKQTNHALNFGRGYKTFSYDLELPEKQGKLLWEGYHRIYPGVRQNYWRGIQNKLRANNRILENCFGRKYLFKDRWGEELFKKAYAFPAQSNTADIINIWGLLPIYYDAEFKAIELLRQMHDAIEFQILLSLGIDKHIELIKKIKKNLEQPLRWKTQEWIIPAECEVGFKRSPMKKLDFNTSLKEQLKEYWK